MEFQKYKRYIFADLYRYTGRVSAWLLFKTLLRCPGYNYLFWLRTTRFFKEANCATIPLYILSRCVLHVLKFRYGIDIPYNTSIGHGFYIGHFGGITVSCKSVIGRNVNINQGVTIGETFGGHCPGTPVIGNNVYVGPGSFIIGGVEIGHHVAIGANTVVNRSLPENAVAVGPSCEIVSYNGSDNYIVNTVR